MDAWPGFGDRACEVDAGVLREADPVHALHLALAGHEVCCVHAERSHLYEYLFARRARARYLLRQYAKLRNAITHSKRVGGKLIADPCVDTVLSIEKICDNLLKPPRLVDALGGYGRPQVFELDDGYHLITTNAVARHFAPSTRVELPAALLEGAPAPGPVLVL